MASDLYLYIKCPDCERKIRHYVKDASAKKFRICPRCGKNIEIADFLREES